MSAERIVVLPAEHAGYVDALVASGAYESVNEVVGAGLLALRERDTTEVWLRDEVLPVAEAMKADPSRGVPAETVFARLRRRHTSQDNDPSQ